MIPAISAAVRRRLHLVRLRENRGQALVEFAFVSVPLLLIIVGMIDFGFIYSNVIGMRQGVSEAGRQASVGQFASSCGTLTGATLSGTAAQKADETDLMCLTHSLDGINNEGTSRVEILVGDSADPNDYVTGQPITICEEYALQSTTGALSPLLSGHVATAAVSVRVETLDSGGLESAQEAPLSGSSWSFCTAPAPVT